MVLSAIPELPAAARSASVTSLSHWPNLTFREIPRTEASDDCRVECHSFLNLLTVIGVYLVVVETETGRTEWSDLGDRVRGLAIELRDRPEEARRRIMDSAGLLVELQRAAAQLERDGEAGARHAATLREIAAVFRRTLELFRAQCERPGGRRWVAAADIEEMLREFFRAVVAQAGGRYEVVHDERQRRPGDYLVRIEVRPAEGKGFRIPPVVLDCLRDVAANARKYTAPGGEIGIEVTDEGGEFRFAVTDNGRGIPSEELPLVVNFGYRASNVRDIRTMGAGFGLTKALHVAARHGGVLTIASAEGVGTRVELRLPSQEAAGGADRRSAGARQRRRPDTPSLAA